MQEVGSYLLDFQDHHVQLLCGSDKDFSNGFTVRRYEDKLYITEILQEHALAVGDAILSIDDIPIADISRLHRKDLFDDIFERQNWKSVIKKARKCLISRDGKSFELMLNRYEPYKAAPNYTFERMDHSTGKFVLSDFNNEQAIRDIIAKYNEEIMSCSNLIFDVRRNGGGTDSAYFPLLSYIFPARIMMSELFEASDFLLTNCTRRNYDLRIKMFQFYLQQELDEFTRTYIKQELEFYNSNLEKGFVPYNNDSIDYEINGQPKPEHIYILSDCYCGSSGDTFVQNSKRSDKVTVVGRNTMGITDYSNVIYMNYGDYQLMYPTTKVNKNGINGIGVDVDLYIPWTPEHLKRDVDLEKVFSLIQNT
jgi:C-terminal processing protease CtpA/Prc